MPIKDVAVATEPSNSTYPRYVRITSRVVPVILIINGPLTLTTINIVRVNIAAKKADPAISSEKRAPPSGSVASVNHSVYRSVKIKV